jgi:hypothetical protein
LSPLSLLTFFAAAKKVSAAPHRGNANRPQRIQGKANTKQPTEKHPTEKNKKNMQSQPKPAPQAQTLIRCAGKTTLTSARNPDQSQTDT